MRWRDTASLDSVGFKGNHPIYAIPKCVVFEFAGDAPRQTTTILPFAPPVGAVMCTILGDIEGTQMIVPHHRLMTHNFVFQLPDEFGFEWHHPGDPLGVTRKLTWTVR